MKIFAFDFDGTLTKRDSFIEFIRYVKGTKELAIGILRHLPMLLMMKLGLYHNGRAKRVFFSYFFAGMKEEEFNNWCRKFAASNKKMLRPKGIERVNEELSAGNNVLIVSASVDNWVRPFFDECQQEGLQIVGTRVAVENGVLTGRFTTRNCYGIEKVRRIKELYPDRKSYFLTAFGDSRGDMEMLDFSDEGHYKPFRK